jgi:hypothetical protein
VAAPGPYLEAGGEVGLEVGVGQHHRPDVAALDHPAAPRRHPLALAPDELGPHGRVGGHDAHRPGDLGAPDLDGGVDAVDRDGAGLVVDPDLDVADHPPHHGSASAGSIPRRSAAKATARYIAPVSRYSSPRRPGQVAGDGGLPRSCGAVDGDHLHRVGNPTGRRAPAGGTQLLERLEEARERLGHAARARRSRCRSPQAEEGEAHGHAVVVVGLHHGRPGRPRVHDEAVVLLVGLDPAPLQLAHGVADAVGLLAADEADARSPWSRSTRTRPRPPASARCRRRRRGRPRHRGARPSRAPRCGRRPGPRLHPSPRARRRSRRRPAASGLPGPRSAPARRRWPRRRRSTTPRWRRARPGRSGPGTGRGPPRRPGRPRGPPGHRRRP